MLDSSSSDEEVVTGGFTNYGNNPTASVPSGPARRVMTSGKAGVGRQYTRPVAQDSMTSIGANTPNLQRHSGKWSNGQTVDAGAADYSDQPSTPYRNVPSTLGSVTQQRSRHSSSRSNVYDTSYEDRSSHGHLHRGPQSRLRSQHSVSGRPVDDDEELSVSTVSLNTPGPGGHPDYHHAGYENQPPRSSTYSVDSSNSGGGRTSGTPIDNQSPYRPRMSNSSSGTSQAPEFVGNVQPVPNPVQPMPKDPAALELEKTEREEVERRKTLQLLLSTQSHVLFRPRSSIQTDCGSLLSSLLSSSGMNAVF